ncbi:MAG: hypothetical protein LBK53_05610 [Heliobacteriaceae bacterium]|jgi:hypothetical protein|nr:hypothetical protein [Heliobacteriaceae bacterium]
MKVNAANLISFTNQPANNTQKQTGHDDMKNPISRSGEKSKLTKAVFWGGLCLGGRLLLELLDGGFLFEHAGKAGDKIAEKNYKNASKNKKAIMSLLSTFGVIGIGIGAFAALYTLFNIPKIQYKGNVNAFTKGKNMDVYIKSNRVEKEIYTQMNEKAKTADATEKVELAGQFMQMQAAETKVPEFVKLK